MSLANGILKTKDQNCGICSMVVKIMENTLGSFQFQIGLRWIWEYIKLENIELDLYFSYSRM